MRVSFHPSHLPLASAITAVVPRRRRAGDASAVSRRAGSPSRDGNLRVGSGRFYLRTLGLVLNSVTWLTGLAWLEFWGLCSLVLLVRSVNS